MRFRNLLLAGAAVALAVAARPAGATAYLSIDNFDGPETVAAPFSDMLVSVVGVGVATAIDNAKVAGGVAQAAFGGIIGGYRDIQTEVFSVRSGGGSTASVFVDGGVGEFSHSQDSGALSETRVTWNGLDVANGGTGKLGAAGKLANYDTLEIQLTEADKAIWWRFEFTDSDGDVMWKLLNTVVIDPDNGDLPQKVTAALNTFALTASGNGVFDWDAVSQIKLFANVPNPTTNKRASSFDTTVDFVRLSGPDILVETPDDPTDTPEPATLSLFGLGLLGLAAAARRRRKA